MIPGCGLSCFWAQVKHLLKVNACFRKLSSFYCFLFKCLNFLPLLVSSGFWINFFCLESGRKSFIFNQLLELLLFVFLWRVVQKLVTSFVPNCWIWSLKKEESGLWWETEKGHPQRRRSLSWGLDHQVAKIGAGLSKIPPTEKEIIIISIFFLLDTSLPQTITTTMAFHFFIIIPHEACLLWQRNPHSPVALKLQTCSLLTKRKHFHLQLLQKIQLFTTALRKGDSAFHLSLSLSSISLSDRIFSLESHIVMCLFVCGPWIFFVLFLLSFFLFVVSFQFSLHVSKHFFNHVFLNFTNHLACYIFSFLV